MKYIITGSTGHISKPLAAQLLKAGHAVTIVSSNTDKVKEIESMGAQAAIGSIEDPAFLRQTFTGADIVYLMIPPKWTVTDWLAYQKTVADNYVNAITTAGVKKVVVLSSVGAHMKKGAGPIDGTAYLEDKISALGIDAVFLRPGYFYYNLFSMIPLIKNAGIMGGTQPTDQKMILTHTNDIADVAADILLKADFKGTSVRYIGSDEYTWKEITTVLGAAIGKPELQWVEFTDEQSYQGMLQAGLSEPIAKGYMEMGKALRSGEMQADYWKNKPVLGKVKLNDFSKEFSAAYSA